MSKDIAIPNNQSDEIDLVELVKVLWSKKWWILLSTFVCTALAGLYAFTAKEQWTSRTEIVAPRIADLGDYFRWRKEYARILGVNFDAGALSAGLYGQFERLAYSLDEREAFLRNAQIYKQLSEGKNDAAKRALLSSLARENISIVKVDTKKEPYVLGRKYAFYAENPELAQGSLKEFINYINEKAFKLELDEFLILANETVADLKFELTNIERSLNIQKNVRLENLEKALDTAVKRELENIQAFLKWIQAILLVD